MREKRLFAKFKKCDFWLKEISFLGHIIFGQGISVDLVNVEAILNWEAPKSVMEVRSLFGLAGYYQRFIEDFPRAVVPMTKLTKKDENFEWTNQCEQSFQELKRRLMEAPVLALPQEDIKFVVYTDVSRNSLGCVLMQNGRVIAYVSI